MASKLFMPELVVPAQFFDDTPTCNEPEGRLMLAILQDAIQCLVNRSWDPASRALAEKAEAWICSTDDSWLHSFECICETLGLDTDVLREKLLARVRVKSKNRNRRKATIVSLAERRKDACS